MIMALLKWKPEYSVGVAGVDLEHRELIAMINEVDEHLTQLRESDYVE